jgi:transcriptional regulator with XRE-family HTH domain
MDDWDILEAELLKDPATRAAYEEIQPRFDLANQVIQLRTKLGLTQEELAERAGLTLGELWRIEGMQVQPNWETIARVLAAVSAEVEIKARTTDGKLIRLKFSPAPELRRRPRKAKTAETAAEAPESVPA